ncbi:hypothetical protein Tco_0472642 [Tanacetum coccineum]
MDLEHGSERMKSPEKIEEEDVDTQKEMKKVSKESGARNERNLLPRKSTRKDVESLSTKYPIVDWKTYTLSENFMYYKIIKGESTQRTTEIRSESSMILIDKI